MAKAVRDGALARPARSIRFVLGWECGGSAAYFSAYPQVRDRTLCGIVTDMVGTEAIDRAHLCVWHNPLSNLSFADALIAGIIRAHRRHTGEDYHWEEKPFSVGTDNMLGDPMWGMPTVAMITEPALSYHSSKDRPDRIDPAILHRNGVLAGAYLYTAAGLTAGELADWAAKARRYLPEVSDSLRREFLRFLGGTDAPEETPVQPFPSDEAAARVPLRMVLGCLTFAGREDLKDSVWQPAWNDRLNLPLFWADGRRSLWQIAVLSAVEAGENIESHWPFIKDYFSFLAEHGYITFLDL